MAPRTAKAKKAAEVKATESEVAKKGKGKAKNISEAESIEDDKVSVAEKKTNRRGKKVPNYDEELNGESEENAPSVKKAKSNKNVELVDDEKPVETDDSSVKESGTPAEVNDDNEDANGHSEDETTPPSKGRKKVIKKEVLTKPKDTAKSRKQQESSEPEVPLKDEDEKPKGRGRGRRGDPKPEPEHKSEDEEINEPVEQQPTKGRKKVATKAEKEAEKAAKDAEKAAKAAAKEAEKAAKSAAKEAEKAAKEAEKAAEKAAKDAEKAAKIAVRDAEKAAKLAAKDAEKAAKLAEKSAEKAVAKNTAEDKPIANDDEDPEVEENESGSKGDNEPKKGRKAKAKAKDDSSDIKEDKESNSEKGDTKDDNEMEVDNVKPSKTKRGQKKAAEKTEAEESPDTGEPTTKRRRKAPEDKGGDTKKKINKAATEYEDIDFSNPSKNSQDKEWNLKISCWNVDGIRAWLGKGGLDYIKYEKPNILCLQEIKCSRDKLPEEVTNIPGYHAYWLCSDKEGYAGVGIYTTKLAMNVQYGLQNEEFDDEGRIITAEYEQFYLICTYVPNSGRKLVTLDKRLKWNEAFRKHVKALDAKKPVIICGDMNVSHNEIDLTNPKSNKRNAGFTEEERAGMTQLLGDGFVDTFRHLYPDKTGAYTFWSYMFNSRAKNVGWRLDYFILSERLLPSLCDSVIRDKVYGSDHCPISLFLHLSTADKPKE